MIARALGAGGMSPFQEFVFNNPEWVDLPMRILLGCLFLVMFLLSLRLGVNRAVQIASRFRLVLLTALLLVFAWMLFGYSVLNPNDSWWG